MLNDEIVVDKNGVSSYARVLEVCPPRSAESLPVPIHAIRSWLRKEGADQVVDVEGIASPEDQKRRTDASVRKLLRFRFDEVALVGPADVRPGDVLVAPAEWGGLSDGNWDASATEKIADVHEEAQLSENRTPVLRLHKAIRDRAGLTGTPPIRDADESTPAYRARLMEWLRTASTPDSPEWAKQAIGALRAHQPDWVDTGFDHGLLRARVIAGKRNFNSGIGDDPSDNGLSFIGGKVPLHTHCAGVGEIAGQFANRLGLSPELVKDLQLAGEVHDLGKADPRFQCWLHGGDAISALAAPELLAKSGVSNSAAVKAARLAARYPQGARHEVLSEKLLHSSAHALDGAHDRDLVCHLVITHHGNCRPLPAAWNDPNPPEVQLSFRDTQLVTTGNGLSPEASVEHVDRFWRLVARFGWHGLAFLESILRIADFRRSEFETGGST